MLLEGGSSYPFETYTVLIGRRHFAPHRGWAGVVVLVTLAAIAWYAVAGLRSDRWPGGSSLPGFVFGIAGGALIFFEFLLWPRKRYRSVRIGRAQLWLRAHIWLGLLTVPLIVLHSGFIFGGWLSTWLMILFAIVIASGIFGLAMQQFLPRKILDEVPAETIFSQIDRISRLACLSAEELVLSACGPDPAGRKLESDDEAVVDEGVNYVAIGAVRGSGHVQGKVLQTQRFGEVIENTELLRDTFYTTIAPYLEHGRKSGSPLAQMLYARRFFQTLEAQLNPAVLPVINSLQELCEQRRQLDRQAWLHFWLHSWLCVHLPLSVALVVLMFVHIFVALKYW